MIYSELLKKVQLKFKNNEERLIHTLNVVDMAVKLSKHYNLSKEDIKKIKVAALMHDYTKYESLEFHKKYLSKQIFNKHKNEQFIYHAYSAANYIKEHYNIKDDKILNSIKSHVYGKISMTIFDKIILISDKIEINRKFPKANYFRKLAFEDLDLSVLLFLKDNISYNESEGKVISNYQKEIIDKLEKEYYGKTKQVK